MHASYLFCELQKQQIHNTEKSPRIVLFDSREIDEPNKFTDQQALNANDYLPLCSIERRNTESAHRTTFDITLKCDLPNSIRPKTPAVVDEKSAVIKSNTSNNDIIVELSKRAKNTIDQWTENTVEQILDNIMNDNTFSFDDKHPLQNIAADMTGIHKRGDCNRWVSFLMLHNIPPLTATYNRISN